MKKTCSIGVFDSGLGGVSVLKKIIKLMPHEDIIYFGDTKNMPYGEKSIEEIQNISLRIVNFLIVNGCKAIVVACNTASVASIKLLQETFSIPIIGMVDAGVDAILNSNAKEVTIIATPVTINSEAHRKKIEKANKNITVHGVECEKLCPMIESGWEKNKNRNIVLDDYMSNVPNTSEAILLGCTHYPFIEKDIAKRCSCKIIDPSDECAREVFRKLKEIKLLNDDKNKKGRIEFYISGEEKIFKSKAEKFLGTEIQHLYKIKLD